MSNTLLLTEIEAFLQQTGMGPTYFGKLACGNTELVRRLRDVATGAHERQRNSSVGIEVANRVRAFMAEERMRRGLPQPNLGRPSAEGVTS